MATVVQLFPGTALTVRGAADALLDSLRNPTSLRTYAIGLGKTVERLGEARPVAGSRTTRLARPWSSRGAPPRSTPGTPGGQRCCPAWPGAANAATKCRRCWPGPIGWPAGQWDSGPLEDGDRPADRPPGGASAVCGRRRCGGCCTKPAARAEEILGVNLEELDLAGRRAAVKAKGARPRTRWRGEGGLRAGDRVLG